MNRPTSAHEPPPDTRHVSLADGDLSRPIDLRQFLKGIGPLLQLETRPPEPTPARPSAAAAEQPAKAALPNLLKASRVRVIGGGVVALMVLVTLLGGIWSTSADVPTELHGWWHTSNPRYATRAFAFEDGTVQFRTGAGAADFTMHEVQRVQRRVSGDTAYYKIEYVEGEGTVTLALSYYASPTARIQFVNQPDLVWTREAARK